LQFNELPHFIHFRLAASQAAAVRYVNQIPSPLVTHIAKFVAFVVGAGCIAS
jgi:autophagy-related protein 9